MPLQLRRGNTAEVNSITPLVGELVYDSQLKRIKVGDGSTAGGIAVAGVTINEAKDAAAASLLAGTHQNIAFSYNSTTKVLSATVDILTHDTIEADAIITDKIFNTSSSVVIDVSTGAFTGTLTGNVNGNVSGNVNGVVTGTAGSSLVGNTTGYHTGDVKGSVFGDNSSIIVDGLNGDVHASRLHMGNAIITQAAGIIDVPANTTIGGQPFAVRIGTDDSNISSFDMNDVIQLVGDVGIDTFLDGTLIRLRNNGITTVTAQSGESELHYVNFTDTFNGPGRTKADGNLRYTPSTGEMTANRIIASTQINTPTLATTNIITSNVQSNGALILYSNQTTTSDTRLVTVGAASVDGRFQVATSTYYSGGLALVNINQSHSTADAVNFQFNRSRGSLASPTVVQSGDDIADITFAGYDGTANQVRAAISASVTGAVSSGTVPLQVVISTSVNGSGAPVAAVTVNDKQQTTFAGAIALATYVDATARNTAIPTPTAGMMVYISGTGKFQGYNGLTTTWDDLN